MRVVDARFFGLFQGLFGRKRGSYVLSYLQERTKFVEVKRQGLIRSSKLERPESNGSLGTGNDDGLAATFRFNFRRSRVSSIEQRGSSAL
jgi:hypothetical protein